MPGDETTRVFRPRTTRRLERTPELQRLVESLEAMDTRTAVLEGRAPGPEVLSYGELISYALGVVLEVLRPPLPGARPPELGDQIAMLEAASCSLGYRVAMGFFADDRRSRRLVATLARLRGSIDALRQQLERERLRVLAEAWAVPDDVELDLPAAAFMEELGDATRLKDALERSRLKLRALNQKLIEREKVIRRQRDQINVLETTTTRLRRDILFQSDAYATF